MKLSQDIIYYHLSAKHPARFVICPENAPAVGRPVFFDREQVASNATVLIDAEDLRQAAAERWTDHSLLICNGPVEPADFIFNCAVIAVEPPITPYKLFNELQMLFDLFDEWNETLESICRDRRSYLELVNSCDGILNDPISILDKDFHYVAYSKLSEKMGLVKEFVGKDFSMPLEIMNIVLNDASFSNTFQTRGTFFFPYYLGDIVIRNLFFEDEYVGRIMLRTNDSSERAIKYYTAVLERLGVCIETLYGRHMSFSQGEISLQEVKQMFLDGLARKEITVGQWDGCLREIGWNAHDELQLVQLRTHPGYGKSMYARYVMLEIESQWRGCVCLEYAGRFLLAVNLNRFHSSDYSSFQQALPYFLRENLLVAGVSRSFNDARHLCNAYDQTELALEFGARRNPTFWYFKFNEYVLDFMVSTCDAGFEPKMLCSEKLLSLRRHDAEAGTAYFETLRQYVLSRYNAVAAAKKMFIHRSTFINRMERIQELVNVDYDSNDELLYLWMSFKMLEGSAALASANT